MVLMVTATTCNRELIARQTLRPAPPLECLRAALAASPDVVEITREFNGGGSEGFWADLRDTTAEGGRRQASILRGSGSAAMVTVSFGWLGMRQPPLEEERRAAVLAVHILEQFRRRCAPDAPSTAMCSRGNGKFWPCIPTA
jgi:hypothetical protein